MSSNFDQISYQHLKIFLAVYRHRSATHAACELGLTNSAVSRTLSALRNMFDDELFIRAGNGLIPTDKAKELSEPAENALGLLRTLDTCYSRFDPSQSEGVITIHVYDEFNYAVQRVINETIKPLAPRMSFRLHQIAENSLSGLINGSIDFAVVYEGYNDTRLNYDCFGRTELIYLLARKGHPLFELGSFTARDLSKYSLIEIDNYRDMACPLLVDVCHESGCSIPVSSYTESVSCAFQLLSSSDSVAVVCNQFTRQFANMVPDLQYVVLPAPILQRIRQMRSVIKPIGNYICYGSTNSSPTFKWVRDQLLIGLKKAWVSALNAPQKEFDLNA